MLLYLHEALSICLYRYTYPSIFRPQHDSMQIYKSIVDLICAMVIVSEVVQPITYSSNKAA